MSSSTTDIDSAARYTARVREAITPAALALIDACPPDPDTATITELMAARDRWEQTITTHIGACAADPALSRLSEQRDVLAWLRLAQLALRDAVVRAGREQRTP